MNLVIHSVNCFRSCLLYIVSGIEGQQSITLFRSIRVFCGTDNISGIFLDIVLMSRIFCMTMLVPHKTIMDLNNVMKPTPDASGLVYVFSRRYWTQLQSI